MKLFVANLAQKVLFDTELKGQLSDGYWENARPSNHYQPWCSAEVVVAEAGQPLGRTFFAPRDTYNFAAKDLLEVVGTRMIVAVRLTKALGDTKARMADCLFDIDGTFRGAPVYEGCYWDGKRADARQLDEEFGLDAIKAAAADESLYDEKQLKRDLKQLKEIVRARA